MKQAPGQTEKAQTFTALHERDAAFVIPNPWDVGTARILANMGFEALATTSAGFAFSAGLVEGEATLDAVLAHCRLMVDATGLPVSADLENGYGADIGDLARVYRRAAETGLVGASIEDFSGNPDAPIYELNEAVDRCAAALEGVRSLPFHFTFTARAENYLHGRPDLYDTIERLQAFEKAGADVLYAPGLPDLDAVRTVCQSVGKPVNVVRGLTGAQMSVAELSDAGVRRISVGASMARAALGAFIRAAREVKDQGTFDYAAEAASFREIGDLLK
jgi:2-methylisocitrate lyase-like PEP mutase family enzyme